MIYMFLTGINWCVTVRNGVTQISNVEKLSKLQNI